MQSLFGFSGLLVEKLDLSRRPLQVRVLLHIEGGKGGEDVRGPFRTGVFVADLDQVRLLQSFDIQAARQFANGVFDLGGAIGAGCVGRNQSRHGHDLLQEIFVA